MFNREIFRKTAMDKLSTPDDLDELLQVNSKFSWLFLVSMLCLILGGGTWGIFGKIVNRISMVGSVQQINPPQPIIATESGLIDSVFYLPGDRIVKGQPIAKYTADNQGYSKTISSLTSGEVIELNIKNGDLLTSGKVVAKIQGNQKETNPKRIFSFFVTDKLVGDLLIGQEVNVLVKGFKSESVELKTRIGYISKIPASVESIEASIPSKAMAEQMKAGNYYLVRTEGVPLLSKNKKDEVFEPEDLNGKIVIGEAIISQYSPLAYLFSPSK